MELELHVRDACVVETLRRYVERRFAVTLRRFAHRVRRLRIFVADLNGPRGGVDKRCRILVEVEPSGSLVVEETDVHVYEAIDRAADRLRRRIRRALKRRQALRRAKRKSRPVRQTGGEDFASVAA